MAELKPILKLDRADDAPPPIPASPEAAVRARPRVETPAQAAVRTEPKTAFVINNLPISIKEKFSNEAANRKMSARQFLAYLLDNAGVQIDMRLVADTRRRNIS